MDVLSSQGSGVKTAFRLLTNCENLSLAEQGVIAGKNVERDTASGI